MAEFSTGPQFLAERFPRLAGNPEVEKTVKRATVQGRTIGRSPAERIQTYLDYLKEMTDPSDPERRERGITRLKDTIIDRYVVKVEDVPESYWQSQIGLVRRRGESGDWEGLSDEQRLAIKEKHLRQTREDQRGRLEEWVDYLASDDASYMPDYLKYWVFASMLKLEGYEKGNKEEGTEGRFPERPSGRPRTVKMHPEVNERGLQFIASAYQALAEGKSVEFPGYEIRGNPTAQDAFLEHLKNKDFRSAYTWTQEFLPPISKEEMERTKGKWLPFPQGSSGEAVSELLRGKGSGWCIAGRNMAQEYLNTSDLQIYCTPDNDGNYTIPRVVIVSRGNRVTEVRGIEWEENIDDYIKRTSVIGDKLKTLPGGEVFEQTDQDMKHLTSIEEKMNKGKKLSPDELIFLYEMDRDILYFGVQKDPRIEELRKKRDYKKDVAVIAGCDASQIASDISEVNESTRGYIGPLRPGIFTKLRKHNIEHIYPPGERIRIDHIQIGEKSREALLDELERAGIRVNRSMQLQISPKQREISIVRIASKLLDKERGIGSDSKARRLGLEVSPDEVAAITALRYKDEQESHFIIPTLKGNYFYGWSREKGSPGLSHEWKEWGSSYSGLFLDFIFLLPTEPADSPSLMERLRAFAWAKKNRFIEGPQRNRY